MRKSLLFLFSLGLITATSHAATNPDEAALSHARELQLQYRQGNPAVVPPLVKSLEDAVARSPNNADLWAALGHAYMSREGSMSPPDMPALIATAKQAREAYARSLTLNPNSMIVRASHGMARMVSAQLEGDAPGMMAGIGEMNEAVRQAPKSITVRLTRAFTTIHFPPNMRDTDAVIDDLQVILDSSPGGRYDDVLHVLLGDVYAEMGKPDAARGEYRQVTGASAFAAAQVKLRLTDLDSGQISPASITSVREGTGTRCAMCHATGTDN